MDIREFKLNDQDAVIALWKACNLVVPWNDPLKDINRKLKVDRDLFLVGEVNGVLVASVMGGYEGHRGWINYLAVLPSYRQKGFGRRIMAAVEDRLREKGCPKINLQVRRSNAEVISFYKSLGYGDDNVIGLGKRIHHDDSL